MKLINGHRRIWFRNLKEIIKKNEVKSHKYILYKGEQYKIVQNLLQQDFNKTKPNENWLAAIKLKGLSRYNIENSPLNNSLIFLGQIICTPLNVYSGNKIGTKNVVMSIVIIVIGKPTLRKSLKR